MFSRSENSFMTIIVYREAIVEQKTASGKTQVLEVSARRVSKQLSVEEQAKVATHRHHLHHPPEIIVPPENQFVSLHSEIELTVKVRAAHGAKISWYHDGQQVAVTGRYIFRKLILLSFSWPRVLH